MKAKFFALAALLFGLAACQTEPEGLDVNLGGEQEVMLTVSLPEATRADSAQGFVLDSLRTTDYSLRYILEIYRVDGGNVVDYTTCQRFVETSKNTSMAFPVKLVPGRDYQVVAWADIVEGDSKVDRCYTTTKGLDEVAIIDSMWKPMDETRDAYTGTQRVERFNSSTNIDDMTLTRPFAKLRVVSTDIGEVRKLGIKPTRAVAEYNTQDMNMYCQYNALTKTAFGEQTKSHEFTYVAGTYEAADASTLTLFTDYIFATDEQEVVNFSLEVFDKNNESIKYNNFNTAIPVKRNTLTTIKGDVLTFGENIVVNVNGEINKGDTHAVVNSAEDLQQMINDAPANKDTNITLGGDIDLGDLFSAGTLSTRASATLPIVIAEGKVVALDLNGYKITTPFVEGSTTNHAYAFENHGSLTIQDSEAEDNGEGNGEIKARGIFNYGTMTLKSGIINACDGNGGYGVRNYKGATFTMDGGSIITSYEDGDIPGEGYDASPLRVDEGATATINGGTINNVSNYTVAIDNYGTTTIKGGTFTTIHTTITNSATMTIDGGSFTCNGLEGITAHALWAADGTTTINGGTFNGKDNYNGFNVDASAGAVVNIYGGKFLPVHSGSLYGEGTINVMGGEFFDNPSARVVDDYTVVEAENGLWTVVRKPDVAKIGEEGYTSIQKAVAAAQNGDTILFVADVEQVDGVIITDKNITIDLNGKTFTVTNGANTNNRNFKVNGSSVVTIENGTMIAAGEYSSGAYGTLRTEGTANVTLEDVKLYNSRGNGLNVKACSGTTVTITDAEVYSQYGGGIESAGGIIELTNVKVEQKGMYTAPYNSMAISVNGGGTVTVNSGTYSTECLAAEDANNQGTSHGPWCAGVLNSGGTLIIKGGTFSNDNFGENTLATYARGLLLADTGANIQIEGGTFNAVKAIIDMTNNLGDASRNPSATISGGDFSADPRISGLYASHLIKVADGYITSKNDNGTYTVMSSTLKAGAVLDLGGVEYNDTITALGDLTIKGDTKIKTLKAVNGGTITIEDGKTLTLNDFSFGSKDTASAEYEIKGGTIVASYGFFQHGKYALHSNFETGYMYYSFGSDITVHGTFHSQGKGDGLDYVRGKLTIANGGKSIHDKSLWVGQPASWGAMNASLVIEAGGYVQANSLSVYEGSSLTYSNDADLKYNSVTGTEYITKK